jgi:hypothetical protein
MNMVYFDWPYGHRWNDSGWGGVRWAETVVGQYEQGRLVIDFMDASERVLAWRGSGTRRLPENLRAEEVTRLVDEAVNETLRQFPPGS